MYFSAYWLVKKQQWIKSAGTERLPFKSLRFDLLKVTAKKTGTETLCANSVK